MDLSRKEDRMPVTRRMKELRARHGFTQAECAQALGIRQNTYSEMESGKTRLRRRDLVTLSVLFEMEPTEAFPVLEGEEAAA